MAEMCSDCKYCKVLYVPPLRESKAEFLSCCTLFLSENQVMYLDYTDCYCECFAKKDGGLNA